MCFAFRSVERTWRLDVSAGRLPGSLPEEYGHGSLHNSFDNLLPKLPLLKQRLALYVAETVSATVYSAE